MAGVIFERENRVLLQSYAFASNAQKAKDNLWLKSHNRGRTFQDHMSN